MYTLTKGRPKFVAKTFTRGYPQPLERLERRDLDSRREPFGPDDMNSAPRPVFNGSRSNKYSAPNNPYMNNNRMTQEPVSPQHEETVKFISETWDKVWIDYERTARLGKEGPIIYQEKVAATMRDFEAVDIDKWADKRTLQRIQASS